MLTALTADIPVDDRCSPLPCCAGDRDEADASDRRWPSCTSRRTPVDWAAWFTRAGRRPTRRPAHLRVPAPAVLAATAAHPARTAAATATTAASGHAVERERPGRPRRPSSPSTPDAAARRDLLPALLRLAARPASEPPRSTAGATGSTWQPLPDPPRPSPATWLAAVPAGTRRRPARRGRAALARPAPTCDLLRRAGRRRPRRPGPGPAARPRARRAGAACSRCSAWRRDAPLPDAPAVPAGLAGTAHAGPGARRRRPSPRRCGALTRGAVAVGRGDRPPTRRRRRSGASAGSSRWNTRTAGAAWSTCPAGRTTRAPSPGCAGCSPVAGRGPGRGPRPPARTPGGWSADRRPADAGASWRPARHRAGHRRHRRARRGTSPAGSPPPAPTHVVLASRRGPDAPGAADLAAELTAPGARVTVAACDVADRDALRRPARRPARRRAAARRRAHRRRRSTTPSSTALTTDRTGRPCCAPRSPAAATCDELTRDHDLDAFVLFSSVAGIMGSAGQGDYAAGQRLPRRARRTGAAPRGCPPPPSAWGAWAGGGMQPPASRPRGLRPQRRRPPWTPRRAVARAAPRARPATRPTVGRRRRGLGPLRCPPSTATRPGPLLRPARHEARRRRRGRDRPAAAAPAGSPALTPRRAAGHRSLDLVRAEAAAVLGHGGADQRAAPAGRSATSASTR